MTELYQITTSYSCAGILVRDGVVQYTAPIYRWMRGKPLKVVLQWDRIESWEKIDPP